MSYTYSISAPKEPTLIRIADATKLHSRRKTVLAQLDVQFKPWKGVYKAIRDPNFHEIDGANTVMLLSANGQLYELNCIAACVWELLETPQSLATLTFGLADVFGISHQELAEDLTQLLETFAERGLIDAEMA